MKIKTGNHRETDPLPSKGQNFRILSSQTSGSTKTGRSDKVLSVLVGLDAVMMIPVLFPFSFRTPANTPQAGERARAHIRIHSASLIHPRGREALPDS
ncbi:hypothetical protein IE53DRAFT_209417 [Violaceomyces palustris]|uniref:Uncharacterized protein n=1 Tax=Violaceomyces palustris TaxID=1673888 RepID=A0ACD0NQU8_9BASI|nr:hypothetical protein IE53DRAFT_209417 [Violaceomyces palustris]